MYKTFTISPVISLLAVTSIALPSLAGGVRNVSVEEALSSKVSITVATEGGGVNIDFSQTGEKIYEIGIDDPSMVTVVHCLVTNSCGGAKRPNIRLVVTNIVHKDIPRAKKTKLTVLTEDAAGESSTYEFQVSLSAKPTIYTKYVIGGVSVKGNNAYSPQLFTNGERKALSQKTLVDPDLKRRIETYKKRLVEGNSSKKAARTAGISMDLVKKLEIMGGATTAPAPLPSATIPVPEIPVRLEGSSRPLPPPPVSSATASTPEVTTKSPVSDISMQKQVKNIAWVYQTGKTDNISIANTLSRGIAVASSSRDYSVLDYRYKLNNAILFLRRTNRRDIATEFASIAKRAGIPSKVFLKVLEYGGFKK